MNNLQRHSSDIFDDEPSDSREDSTFGMKKFWLTVIKILIGIILLGVVYGLLHS